MPGHQHQRESAKFNCPACGMDVHWSDPNTMRDNQSRVWHQACAEHALGASLPGAGVVTSPYASRNDLQVTDTLFRRINAATAKADVMRQTLLLIQPYILPGMLPALRIGKSDIMLIKTGSAGLSAWYRWMSERHLVLHNQPMPVDLGGVDAGPTGESDVLSVPRAAVSADV